MPTIVFNGTTYQDVNEMPETERRAFEEMTRMLVDENGNGIPDLLEGDMVQKVLAMHSSKMQVNLNGRTYHSLEELPPDLRQSVDGAFNMLSKMGMLANTPAMENPPPNRPQQVGSKPFLSPQKSSAIEEDKGSGIFSYAIISVVLCFAIAVAAFAIIYFMNR